MLVYSNESSSSRPETYYGRSISKMDICVYVQIASSKCTRSKQPHISGPPEKSPPHTPNISQLDKTAVVTIHSGGTTGTRSRLFYLKASSVSSGAVPPTREHLAGVDNFLALGDDLAHGG